MAKKCTQLKFKTIIEMKPNEFIKLNDDFKIKCVPNGTYDSWFYAEIGDNKILNINDCKSFHFIIIHKLEIFSM